MPDQSTEFGPKKNWLSLFESIPGLEPNKISQKQVADDSNYPIFDESLYVSGWGGHTIKPKPNC